MKLPSVRNRLSREFYNRDPSTVARELLGRPLVRRIGRTWIGGRIVETEAYLSSCDPASHSARGPTPSNLAMFGKPGTLYVYPIHAKYCLNAVTEPEGTGSAVLIRAIEPIWGIPRMQWNRNQLDDRKLTRGPAMLCQALGIDREFDHLDLTGNTNVRILSDSVQIPQVTTTPRIGISQAKEQKLRFIVDGNRYVSGRSRDHQREARSSLRDSL